MDHLSIDYYRLGERVRKYRKALGMTQEDLADMAGISVTHMSHIETANTKLSLEVLVRLADALSISTDLLLFGEADIGKVPAYQEAARILDACEGPEQAFLLIDMMKANLRTLNKYRRKP